MILEYNLFKKVTIEISAPVFYETSNTKWYGFPVAEKLQFHKSEIEENINNVAGYFFYIYQKDHELVIANDITGGFRMYTFEDLSEIIITDNYKVIIDFLRKKGQLHLDPLQFQYWNDHRYTFGDRTFVKNLNKIPPHTVWTIDKKVSIKKSYFKRRDNKPNFKIHKKKIADSTKDIFQIIKNSNPQDDVVLLFSGGKDSRYLASLLQEVGINFTPVFFHSEKSYKENCLDLIKARRGAEMIGIELLEIGVNIEDVQLFLPDIIKDLLFDRHFSLLHYGGFKKLKDHFDQSAIIINGQSSDNVFSYGPSRATGGDFIRRFLLYWPGSLASKLLKLVMEKRMNKGFAIPKDQGEMLRAFLDGINYMYLLNPRSDQYNLMLDDFILKNSRGNTEETLMLLKIGSYLQGSDNQVAIKSAVYSNFNKIVMPFASPGIIYNTLEHKSKIVELFLPKYVVHQKKGKNKNVKGVIPSIENYNFTIGELEEMTRRNFKKTAKFLFSE